MTLSVVRIILVLVTAEVKFPGLASTVKIKVLYVHPKVSLEINVAWHWYSLQLESPWQSLASYPGLTIQRYFWLVGCHPYRIGSTKVWRLPAQRKFTGWLYHPYSMIQYDPMAFTLFCKTACLVYQSISRLPLPSWEAVSQLHSFHLAFSPPLDTTLAPLWLHPPLTTDGSCRGLNFVGCSSYRHWWLSPFSVSEVLRHPRWKLFYPVVDRFTKGGNTCW